MADTYGFQTPQFQDFMSFLTGQVQKEYELQRGDLASNLARRGVYSSPYGTDPTMKLAETTAQQKQGLVANAGWQEYARGRTREEQLIDADTKRKQEIEDWNKQQALALQLGEMQKPREKQWWEMLLPAVGTGLTFAAMGGLKNLWGAAKPAAAAPMGPRLDLYDSSQNPFSNYMNIFKRG